MWDGNPMSFFDLLFQMKGAQVICLIGFENQFFSVFVDELWFSSGLLEYRSWISLNALIIW